MVEVESDVVVELRDARDIGRGPDDIIVRHVLLRLQRAFAREGFLAVRAFELEPQRVLVDLHAVRRVVNHHHLQNQRIRICSTNERDARRNQRLQASRQEGNEAKRSPGIESTNVCAKVARRSVISAQARHD